MSLFFFVYTVIVLIICVVAASVCGSAFVVSHSKRQLPRIGFFVFYFLELAQIFGEEWLGQNVFVIDESNYFAIYNPAFRIVVGAAILACFWMVVLNMLDVHDRRAVIVPTVAIVIVQAAIVAFAPYGRLSQWLFYTMRQVSLLSCLVYAWVLYRTSNDDVLRQRMSKRKHLLQIILGFIGLITLEDVYVILIAPVPTGGSAFMGLFLSARSLSENLMMLYLAWYVCREAIRTLSLRYNEPPVVQAGSKSARQLQGHIENRLPRYAQDHGLSEREREILAFAVEGMSNREIAAKLVLAEGTIKTHLHNIMKKCGVSNREELRKSFWAS